MGILKQDTVDKIYNYFANINTVRVLIISFIVLIIVRTLSRTYVAGVDTYYFLNHICYGSAINEPIGATFIFGLLPCNHLALQVMQLCLLLISLWIMSLIGRFIANKIKLNWEYYVIFILSSFYFVFEFIGNLEDDQLAYPLLFAATYFIIKYIYDKNTKDLLIALGFSLIGLLFWPGALLYVVIVVALILHKYNLWYLALVIPIIFFNHAKRLLPNFLVLENLPFIAIIYLGLCFAGIYMFKRKDIPFKLKILTALLTIIAIINAKFGIHAVPYLGIGLMYLLQDSTKYKKIFIGLLIIVIAIISLGMITQLQPTPELVFGMEESYEISIYEDLDLINDWGLGYHMQFFLQKDVKYKGSPPPKYEYKNSMVMVRYSWEEVENNCSLIKKERLYSLYRC